MSRQTITEEPLTDKNFKRKLWKILESYGTLDRFKGKYMKDVRNELFKELLELYETINKSGTKHTRYEDN